MVIHDNVEQGTLEWFALRAGRITASELKTILTSDYELRRPRAKASKNPLSDGAHTYLCRKAAEIIRGQVQQSFSGGIMEQGHLREDSAVPWYELEYDTDVRSVAFVEADGGRFGCSPDGLIGDDSGLEVKCPEPTNYVEWLLDGKIPEEHWLQVQGSMLATGRASWTFLAYRSDFSAKLVVTTHRDEAIMSKMRASIEEFVQHLDAAVERIKNL